jgi:opacity protein-like surface antigen
LNASTDRTGGRPDGRTAKWAAVLAALLLAVGPSGRLAAQGVLNQFSYDNLRLSGIQVDAGPLGSSELTGAVVAGLRLDYGMIAPHVRVLLGLSYFRSEFDGEARARFEQRIRQFVIDPANDDTIRVGRIFWSDITADLDLQYAMPQGRGIMTYVGAGVSVHLRNGSGAAINGTFVEDALDEVSAGFNASIGAEFALSKAWRFTLDGRGVISSGLSTVSLRSGIMYRLGAAR